MNGCDIPRLTQVRAIPAQNSIPFLQEVFAAYKSGCVFSISRPDTGLQDIVDHIETVSLPDIPQRGWMQPVHTPNASDAPAQIVFTSGTEGRPKPIVLSYRNLADVVTRLNTVMELTAEVREYIGVPVTYSFGLGRARAVAAAGGAFYLPERFDPTEIREMLLAGDINAISAVPSLWQVVLANPDAIGDAGERVRWIEIGSQYMSGTDKVAMKRLFPKARIIQHYGLTEASRSTFLQIDRCSPEAMESVGTATDPVQIRLDDDGAICIKGDHVALGRLQNDGAIVPLTNADGWLTTRDRGELIDGRLHYSGRLDDQINVMGIKLGAEALEDAICHLVPAVQGQIAIAALPDPAKGEIVLLALTDAIADYRALITAAAELVLERKAVPPRGALRVVVVNALPRTETHKIQRKRLPELIAAQTDVIPAAADMIMTDLTPAERQIATIWRRVVGGDNLQADDTFYDIGGDSLSSVQIGLVMEGEGIKRAAVRATLEGRSLREVAALMDQAGGVPDHNAANVFQALPDAAIKSWAVSITRGIMVLSVLFSHWGPGLFGRLGYLAFSDQYLSIISRMGTPGFATVFGLGIGAFMLPQYVQKQRSVLARLKGSFLLVVAGMMLLAAAHLTLAWLQGETITGTRIAQAFYNVLAYYAIALGSAPLWMPLLARLRHPAPWLPLIGFALWGAGVLARIVVSNDIQDGLQEWPRLMSIGGYNIFKMTAVTCIGIAAGYVLAIQNDIRHAARIFLLTGLTGVLVSVAVIVESYGARPAFGARDGIAFSVLPGLIMYGAIAMVLIGAAVLCLLQWQTLSATLRLPLRLLIVTGGLALPIYVFHGLVIPLKDILSIIGTPQPVALLVPLVAFISGMGYMGRRLHRVYFE